MIVDIVGTAPADLVEQLAQVTLPPPRSDRDQAGQYAAHRAKIQSWANQVWAQGWRAGMAYGTSAKAPRVVVTPEVFDALARRVGPDRTGLPS